MESGEPPRGRMAAAGAPRAPWRRRPRRAAGATPSSRSDGSTLPAPSLPAIAPRHRSPPSLPAIAPPPTPPDPPAPRC